MHLFISSSSLAKCNKQWILTLSTALILSLAMALSLEFYWRNAGHIPTVIDDERLWAIERDKININPKNVLLLGKSRIALGFSLKTFKNMYPDYHICQLAIADGSSPVAVLNDLAINTDYRGIIICEISTDDFLKVRWYGQKAYVDYYNKTYNLNEKINRQISTFLQEHFVIMNPNLNGYNLLENLIINKSFPTPQHITMDSKRNYYGDFTKFKKNIKNYQLAVKNVIERQKREAIQSIKKEFIISTYQQPVKNVNFMDAWFFEAISVINLAKIINDRGGRVVFVHYPGILKPINEIQFKNLFWDRLERYSSVEMIHFYDVKSLNHYHCPDNSHLDYRDVPSFTKELINELVNRNIIKH